MAKASAVNTQKTEVKAEGTTGVQYTFTGEYYTGSKGEVREQVKNYELQIIFPQVIEKALALFKTDLTRTHGQMYRLMLKQYPDFKALRTYTIQDIKDLSGAEVNVNSIASMNRKQLSAYITKNNLGINPDVYSDIAQLRCAIEQAQNDPEGFKEIYKSDLEAYEFNKTLANLNPQANNDNSSNNDIGGNGDNNDNAGALEGLV